MAAIRKRRRSVVPPPVGPTRVKQEFKKEVNINTIIAKMRKGVMPNLLAGEAVFADVSEVPQNFQDAFEKVSNAAALFDKLPLGFRKELDYDPRNLMSATREMYERYGILKKPEAPEAASGGSGVPAAPEGAGDRDLPSTGRPGPLNKARKEPGNADEA